jgi:hypothetical protein
LAARHALREKTNTTRVNVATYGNEDDINDLVKNAKETRLRSRAPVAQAGTEEYMMTGGLGNKDSDANVPEENSDVGAGHKTANGVAREQRRPARAARKIVQSDRDKQVLAEVRKRMEATAKGQRGETANTVATTKSSAPSAETLVRKSPEPSSPPVRDRPAGAMGRRRSSTIQPPGSVLRLQNTPALENSLLALKNFRRRPRQSSILHMVQQRNASARPSAAHVTDMDESTLSGLDLELYSDDEDVDDFAPDAEGTPLKLSTTGDGLGRGIGPGAKKRSSSSGREGVEHPSSSRSKRQKIAVPDSQEPEPDADQADSDVVISSSRQSMSPVNNDILVINSETSSLSSTPPTEPPSPLSSCDLPVDDFVIPSTEEEQRNAQNVELDDESVNDDQIMADPLSSSPRRTTRADNAPSGTWAEPISQHSPLPAQRTPTRTRNTKSKTVLTATLTSLLPKRRRMIGQRARRTDYDMDSQTDDDEAQVHRDTSLFDDDEDELANSARRPASRSATAKSRPGRGTTTDKSTRHVKAISNAAVVSKNTTSTSKRKRRTYGRANTASDQENEEQADEQSDGVDVSTTMHEVAHGKELEDARRKFAEVDDWNMEFESMSAEDHRSSSQGWR